MKTRTALASALALALAGCTDNHASVEIFAICAPPDDAAQCGTTGECGALLASPRLQVNTQESGLVNELQAFIELRNQMPNNEDLDLGRVNTNDFVGEEYLLAFRGASGLSGQVYPANFTVPAEGTSTPVVTLIPPATMAQLRTALPDNSTALVIVELRVRGRLVDGSPLETGVFEIAVDVTDANFLRDACPTAGDLRFYCPNAGQTSSTSCEAP